jgi:hypothetical protein
MLFENRIAKRANPNCAFFFRVPGQEEWCRHFYFRFFSNSPKSYTRRPHFRYNLPHGFHAMDSLCRGDAAGRFRR